MTYSRDELRKLTKSELMSRFFQIEDDQKPIAEINIASLPRPYFEAVITQHNAKIKYILDRAPSDFYALTHDLRTLLIPTFAEFQSRLDDTDTKKKIPPEYRKARDYASYQSWVLGQAPISTVFHETFFLRRFPVHVPDKYRKRHVFCVGKSGSGKSETLKLLALSSKTNTVKNTETKYPTTKRDCAFVLIDPHGDLAQEMVRQRLYYGDYAEHPEDPDLIYLDPFLASEKRYGYRFPTINPFDLSGRRYSEFEIEKIAQQLTRVFQSLVTKGDVKLSSNMETLLIPCVTVLLKRPESTMFDLLRFMQREGNEDLVAQGLKSTNEGHVYFFRHSFLEKRFDPTKGALSTKIQTLLNNKIFTNFLAKPKSTINLEQALNSGKSIIVNCASGRAGAQTMEAIGRFLVGMILAVAFNRAENENAPRVPIWLMIDEMQNFVSDEIKTILAEARKYALHLTLACQVVGQDMNAQLNKIVLGNTAVKMVGNAGSDSQRAMSEEMFVKKEELNDLSIGEFVVKAGEQPAVKLKMTSAFVGKRNVMSPQQWEELKAVQISRYYRNQGRALHPENTNDDSHDREQLKEEISAEHVTAETPEHTERKPKHTTQNPFSDLDF